MGRLIDGQWHDAIVEGMPDEKGHFVRQDASFRDHLSNDGSTAFPMEAGRYHLYLAHACPWCHRTAIVAHLAGLSDKISLSFVHPLMLDGGWRFTESHPDPLFGFDFAHQLYTRAQPEVTTRVTVPILWDKQTDAIVNNESSEIIRMFDTWGGGSTITPAEHLEEIEAWNTRIYHTVNNGVYRCGFAHTQDAYDEALAALFETLDLLEQHLSSRDFLVAGKLSEADIRLFVTLIRFDAVYVTHFKCNMKRLVDYPNLQAYTERLYELPAFAETTNFAEIKTHYFASHRSLNPKGIIPGGPTLRFGANS